MTREEVLNKLYNRYICPVENKKESYIGLEVEMPIVNLNHKAVDFEVIHALTAAFLENFGFNAQGFDEEGHIYSAYDPESGDVFSYDCSYNNLELSFGREKELDAIYNRFFQYYEFIQRFFQLHHYTLTGMGVNPNRKLNHHIPIQNGRYKMLFHHLSSFPKYAQLPMYFHEYPQFGMFSSALQIQLDFTKDKLPKAINTFNKLEPIKALLFSNSVLLGEKEQLVCCRDMLWENSTHGINPHNIGMYNCEINSVDDMIEYMATTSIYCVERDGHYLNFRPQNIVEYFQQKSVTGEYVENGKIRTVEFVPAPDDIKYLRTFKFEDLTFRGTVEFRSACCQPISDVMTVAAFHLGLAQKLDELTDLLESDKVLYHKGYNATELRKLFVMAKQPEFVNEKELYGLVFKILDLCSEGLKERGLDEEKYLKPLYERAEKRTNPAKTMLARLHSGEELDDIILDYSKISDILPHL